MSDAVLSSIINSIHCLAVWQYSVTLKLSDAIKQEIGGPPVCFIILENCDKF